ncbi:MAG: DUF4355 domain-containing protein [Peptostreptococcaceae bacterium]|nr:DUF4355 domain-containing protein [Peptostreptococcaceae bacterium]
MENNKDIQVEETKAVVDEPKADLINKDNLTLEELKNIINTNDGFKAWLNSEKDRHFSTSLNTWKENNLAKEVEKEISKRYPAETEEQKKLRDLELKLQSMEQESKMKELKANTMKVINDKKLDSEIIDFVLSDNEEVTNAKIDKLEGLIEKLAAQRLEEKYKNANNTPSTSIGEATLSEYDKSMAKGDVKGMLLAKINMK